MSKINRIAFQINILPDKLEEYKKRHREVWPEVLDVLKQYRISNYSIFLHENTLFAYMEIDGDIKEQFRLLHEHPVSIRWRNYMSDIIIRDENMVFSFMEEVFHLE